MMPLAPSYDYTALDTGAGIRISLGGRDGSAKKEFFVAAASLDGIHQVMQFLTESQCEQHLAIKTHSKKEK